MSWEPSEALIIVGHIEECAMSREIHEDQQKSTMQRVCLDMRLTREKGIPERVMVSLSLMTDF